MFQGFEQDKIDADGVEINLVRGGSGPPVLLLHGYPQSHVMWHKVAPILAQHFTVVATDLATAPNRKPATIMPVTANAPVPRTRLL